MSFATPWIAALLALFVWWISTGAILMVVKRADRYGPSVHMRSVLWGIPVLLAGVGGYLWSLEAGSVVGTYVAFLAALAIWGWIELAFLSGVITGPNRFSCPEDASLWDRFVRAWGTVAYHEILLFLALSALLALAFEAVNTVGALTFAVLFFARISAKLNLFFGVPYINLAFLPEPLRHLPSHFRVARVSAFFPISVTALSFATAVWAERLTTAQTPAEQAGYALLTTLSALALLEHWFMVLPLADEKLWRWMIPSPQADDTLHEGRGRK